MMPDAPTPEAALCLLCRAGNAPCALHAVPMPEPSPRRRETVPSRVNRCGRCNVLGHNRRSCTAPLARDVSKR